MIKKKCAKWALASLVLAGALTINTEYSFADCEESVSKAAEHESNEIPKEQVDLFVGKYELESRDRENEATLPSLIEITYDEINGDNNNKVFFAKLVNEDATEEYVRFREGKHKYKDVDGPIKSSRTEIGTVTENSLELVKKEGPWLARQSTTTSINFELKSVAEGDPIEIEFSQMLIKFWSNGSPTYALEGRYRKVPSESDGE